MDELEKKAFTRRKRVVGIVSLVIFVVLILVVSWFVGKPLIEMIEEPERFRTMVDELGPWSRLAMVGMMALQIVVAIIPGEPMEIGAGYAFGAFEGTLLCLAGALIGSAAIFLLVRTVGVKLVELFISREQIASMKFLNSAKKRNMLVFLLFFIPGTPKDVVTYCAGLTPIKAWVFFLISTLARIPSVITSTVGGGALGAQNYTAAIVVFAITAVISIIGILIYRNWMKNQPPEAEEPQAKGPGEGGNCPAKV